MTEYTYKGYCPYCKMETCFWGGHTWVLCESCDTMLDPVPQDFRLTGIY